MSDPTMAELLAEQVVHIVNALPPGVTLDDWYSDYMMSMEPFGDLDNLQREAVAYATGYLRGVAECANVTVMELLRSEGVRALAERGTALTTTMADAFARERLKDWCQTHAGTASKGKKDSQ